MKNIYSQYSDSPRKPVENSITSLVLLIFLDGVFFLWILISFTFASIEQPISKSTLDYWKNKLMIKNMANNIQKMENPNELVRRSQIGRLKQKLADLKDITDFQQELIPQFGI